MVINDGKRILATRNPFTKPTIPPKLTAKIIDIQMGIPVTANATTAVPERAITAPREKSTPPTINTRAEPVLRIVNMLVCTRRLSTPRTVKKLFAKIEKSANIITKTARGKSLFDDNLSWLQFNLRATFSASESSFSFFIICIPKTLFEDREINTFCQFFGNDLRIDAAEGT